MGYNIDVDGNPVPEQYGPRPRKILKTSSLVACPKCGALPGRQCITSGGKRTAIAHVQRKQEQHRQGLDNDPNIGHT